MNWEVIDDYHQRLSVRGGWIFQVCSDVMHNRSDTGQGMIGGWDYRVAICFIPDPNHEWVPE